MTRDLMKMQILVHRSWQGWGQQSAFLESSQVLQLLQEERCIVSSFGAMPQTLNWPPYCFFQSIPHPTVSVVFPNANLNKFLHFPCFPCPQILPLPPIPPSGSHSSSCSCWWVRLNSYKHSVISPSELSHKFFSSSDKYCFPCDSQLHPSHTSSGFPNPVLYSSSGIP